VPDVHQAAVAVLGAVRIPADVDDVKHPGFVAPRRFSGGSQSEVDSIMESLQLSGYVDEA
jgi:hypothetical protein